AGLTHPQDLNRRHIVRRLSASQIKLADQIYPKVETGALIRNEDVEDVRLSSYWERVDQSSFQPVC
ncbi:MAG: FMN-binding glutamate synthase family protein, partial [Pseudomonadota bacterium]|nr:FMN-binding glutamate synthase family protein [Pseudomonadota bacterium]